MNVKKYIEPRNILCRREYKVNIKKLKEYIESRGQKMKKPTVQQNIAKYQQKVTETEIYWKGNRLGTFIGTEKKGKKIKMVILYLLKVKQET